MMAPQTAQCGATLLVSLIMLILLTLLAISAINTSTGNLRMVGNMQAQTRANSAAEAVLEALMSNPAYFVVGYAPPAIPVDLDGDGGADFNVTVDQLICKGSSAPPGFSAPMPIESNLWEITVRATDANTGATTVVRQGVRMNQLSTYCT